MEQIEVKKSIKHKPPVIRQTLTSMFRIAKANPLLFMDAVPKFHNDPSSLDLNKARLPNHLKPLNKNLVEITNKTDNKTVQHPSKSKIQSKSLKPCSNLKVNGNNNVTQSKHITSVKPWPVRDKPKPKPAVTIKPTQTKASNETTGPRSKSIIIKKRRSLSAEHYDRKKHLNVKCNVQSLTDLQKNTESLKAASPVEERRVTFQTPIRSNRTSSAVFTPTPFVQNHSTPYVIRTNYQLSDLHKKLHEWLRLHKKPFGSYRTLKCFGLDNANNICDDENKENIEDERAINTSYEDLKITTPVNPVKEPEDLQDVVQETLSDLHRLITEGFSTDQSEAWLNLISQKYNFLEDKPQYWECRAAIEQNRGNITSAVECLQTAIVQGAEVKFVDKSLEQLLQKFSLLKITPGAGNMEESSYRARIVKDARNVFKSSIIQFAIQERNLKKKTLEGNLEKKYVATPVRRSTRLTPSRYRVTPKVQIYSSLQDLDDGVKSNMEFFGNKQLKVRFSSAKKKKD